MDKKTLVTKLDDGISTLREILQENDGSSIKALTASAGQGFRTLKTAFAQNEKAQRAVAEIKKQLDGLEEAIKKGDKRLSAKLLVAAEKKIQKYKAKFAEQETSPFTEEASAAPKAATKAKKTSPTKPKPAAKAKEQSSELPPTE